MHFIGLNIFQLNLKENLSYSFFLSLMGSNLSKMEVIHFTVKILFYYNCL